MISLQLSQINSALNGKLIGNDITISSVSTDTRSLVAGDLFIALSGDNFDANTFLTKAIELGASAAIVTKKQPVDIPQIVVKDSRIALGLLGKLVRTHIDLKVAGLTGSNGKTTTKEMLAAILQLAGPTLATAGNFNNDIGVPLTLLRLEPTHQFAVIEQGANHKKEIAYTTELAQPDVVLINNVDAAHLEGFGDLQGVAQAKGEILTALKYGAMAVLNRDDKFYKYWLRRIKSEQHISFSLTDSDADFYADDIKFDEQGNGIFTLVMKSNETTKTDSLTVSLPIVGRHNIANALAAAAMASRFDISLAMIKQGLEQMSNVKGRLKLTQFSQQIRLIDDTYNANVASVKAAVDVLKGFASTNILVLGDMGELGSSTAEFHQQVGSYAQQQGIDHVYTCGVLSREAALMAGAVGRAFLEKSVLVDALHNLITGMASTQAMTILFKGSRSAQMEQAITLLTERLNESNENTDKERKC